MKKLLSSGHTYPTSLIGGLLNYLMVFTKRSAKTPNNEKEWHDVTRRETIDGAEAAINGSIDHFSKKLEAIQGPKVVKTFE